MMMMIFYGKESLPAPPHPPTLFAFLVKETVELRLLKPCRNTMKLSQSTLLSLISRIRDICGSEQNE